MTSGAAMTRRECVAGPRSVWQSQAMPGKRLEPGSVRGGTKGSSRAASASRGPTGGANGDRVLLEAADDGTGFDASADSGKGLGLGVMRYRAGLFGGELRIKSAPGKGTQVICSVPMST